MACLFDVACGLLCLQNMDDYLLYDLGNMWLFQLEKVLINRYVATSAASIYG